ncbi:MAG: lmo0937 family membrane protein [Fimbriimonadaceae bacterium]|nr:lmo0937 family membrane protein [Fimbriimonadaceae bacterium]
MLWTIVLILGIMWILGMVTANTMGGLLHILLILAVIVVIVNLLRGRRAL